MNKKFQSIVIFFVTLFYLIAVSPLLNAQSDSELPAAPDTGTPTEESVPGGTRSPWSEAINNIEITWENLYENYFEQDFESLNFTSEQISEKLADLEKQTGKKAAVIWLIPQPEYLSISLVTPGQPATGSRVLAANKESLTTLITDFQTEISNPQSRDYLGPAQQLYQWLISPIEYHLLKNNIDTLILCVGSNLRSLPFAALYDGENFLIEKFNLSLIPGFNLSQWDRVNIEGAKILAMGASEFEQNSPLRAVPIELELITPQLWPGISLLNQDFTINNLAMELEKKDFDIVHLATHAQFQSGLARDSYIQFSDARLSLAQMNQLNWRKAEVDLLVLSACNTARGNTEAELGFVGLAINAGVKTAIGSLWRVSDVGTLGMMSEFYGQLQQTLNPATALRQTQIALLKKDVQLEDGVLRNSQETVNLTTELGNLGSIDLSHPYFWAGFTLIGNPF